MQSARNTAASAKETAQNIGASAKSGMDKTKATMQEKYDKMTAHDPLEKEMARDQRDERIHQAETNKQEARELHAADKEATRAGGGTGGLSGYPAGTDTDIGGPGLGGGSDYSSYS